MCSYVFDEEMGSWVLTLPRESKKTRAWTESERLAVRDTTVDDQSSAQDQLEEHALLLAIQAAHAPSADSNSSRPKLAAQRGTSSSFYSRYSSSNSNNNNSDRNNNVKSLGRSSSRAKLSEIKSDSSDDDNDDDDASSDSHALENERPPAELILLVVSIHFLNCFIKGFFLTLVPIWMVSATNNGGLDYGVRDCTMAVSATGVALLLLQAYVGPKAQLALKIFPVRTLRIAAGCVCIFSFMLTKFARFNGVSPWAAPPEHTAATRASVSSGGWLLWLVNSVLAHTYTVEAHEHGSGGEGLFLLHRPSPACNLLSVLIPAALLGALGTGCQL